MSVTSLKVECIFCKSAINVLSDLTKDYKKHLMIEHNIIFDIDHVINRTLLVQHPSMARNNTCDCQLRKADDNIEDLLDSYTDYDDIIIETLRNDIAIINEKSSKKSISNIFNKNSKIEEAEEDEKINFQNKDDEYINDEDMIDKNKDVVNTGEEVISKDQNKVDNDGEKINERTDEVILRDKDVISKGETNVINGDKDVNNGNVIIGGEDVMNGRDYIATVENIINEEDDKITKCEDNDNENIIDKADVNKEIVHGNQMVDNHMEIVNETNGDIKKDEIFEFDSSYFCTTVQSKLMKNIQTDVCVVRRSTRISKLKDEGILGDYQIDDHNKLIITKSTNSEMCNLKETANVGTPMSPMQLPWYYGCLYTCEECPKQFVDRHEFIEHIKIVHSITFEKYVTSYTSAKIVKNQHECEQCGMGVAWYKTNLEKHFEMHEMRMDEYYDKYKSEFEIPILKISDPSLLQKLATLNPSSDVSTNSDYDCSWTNKCIYLCKLCKKSFDSRSKFDGHVKSVHKLSMSKYSKKYGRAVKHEEKHHCQIKECTSKVLWEKLSISQHLKKCHNSMTLQDYKKSYMDNYVKKENTEVDYSSTNNYQYSETSSWANKCVYECDLCNDHILSKRKFIKHILNKHSISFKEYIKKHKVHMSTEQMHHCQIQTCDSIIWWDKLSIYNHLRINHKQKSLQDYNKQFMSNYTENNSKTQIEKMIKAEVCKPTNNSNIVNNSETQSEKTTKPRLPAINSWANRCIYKCKICEVTKKSRHSFKTHINSQHKMSLKEFSKEHGTTMEHKETHHCQMENCQSIILWDANLIYQHLFKKHSNSISLEKYGSQFMSSYSEKKNCVDTETTSTTDSDSVSLWNKNEYKCRLENCQFSCTGRNKLKGHLSEHHKTTTAADYFKTHKNSRTTNEYHICQMCGVSILWDLLPMQSHIYQSHRLTLESYRIRYMDNYSKHTKIDKNNFPEAEESEQVIKWSAGSLLLCKLCDEKVVGMYQFTKHLGSQHNFSFNKYEKSYKDFTLHTGFHFCKICGKNIKHDLQFLKAHMAEHDMSLEKYFNEFNPRMPKVIRIIEKYGY